MKVKFVPLGLEFEIKSGQSVMHLAEDNGIYIKSVCRGVPSCAECRVKIVEGENNVFAPAGEELALIGSGWFIDRRRLSCQLQCLGDVTIDVSEQIAKQQGLVGGRKSKLAKAVGDRIEDETVIRDSSAENERLRDSAESQGPRISGSSAESNKVVIQPRGRTEQGTTGGIQPVIQPRTDSENNPGSGPGPDGNRDKRGGDGSNKRRRRR